MADRHETELRRVTRKHGIYAVILPTFPWSSLGSVSRTNSLTNAELVAGLMTGQNRCAQSCKYVKPIILLGLLAACSSKDRAAARRPDSLARAAAVDTSGVARPLWQFGESSLRTDTLPAELDSLRDWGEYRDTERPVAYAVDLNRDGKVDWLVRSSTRLCGPFGGCPIRLLTQDATGKWTASLDDLAEEVMITNKIVNDWPVLWTYLRGIDGGVFEWVFQGGTYLVSATLLSRRKTSEWTAEQYAADTIWQRIQSLRVP